MVLPCDFEEYEKVSVRIYDLFIKYTNRVQAVSADEAFLDMSVFAAPVKVEVIVHAHSLVAYAHVFCSTCASQARAHTQHTLPYQVIFPIVCTRFWICLCLLLT